MDYSQPGSSVHGISQARLLEWLPFSSTGDLPKPGIHPMSPDLADRFFTAEPPGKHLLHLGDSYLMGLYNNQIMTKRK